MIHSHTGGIQWMTNCHNKKKKKLRESQLLKPTGSNDFTYRTQLSGHISPNVFSWSLELSFNHFVSAGNTSRWIVIYKWIYIDIEGREVDFFFFSFWTFDKQECWDAALSGSVFCFFLTGYSFFCAKRHGGKLCN